MYGEHNNFEEYYTGLQKKRLKFIIKKCDPKNKTSHYHELMEMEKNFFKESNDKNGFFPHMKTIDYTRGEKDLS